MQLNVTMSCVGVVDFEKSNPSVVAYGLIDILMDNVASDLTAEVQLIWSYIVCICKRKIFVNP